MSVTALRNQRERNRKTARPTILGNLTSNDWEDFDAKASERKESKIYERKTEWKERQKNMNMQDKLL